MPRSSACTLTLFVLLAALVAGGRLSSAPRGADRPDPAPDHRTGTLAVRMDSPVLLVPNGAGEDTVWLVFRREFAEDAALSGVEAGRRLTVRGKAGAGGKFAYLVVHEVAPAD